MNMRCGGAHLALIVGLVLSAPAILEAQQIAIGAYPVPTVGGEWGITAGPDGALWFTEFGGNKIGRITAAGLIIEYPVPTTGSVPRAITSGPDGALWFTESIGKIGRITTAGVFTEYPLLATTQLYGITAGPDGALWFTEYEGNKIGRITTNGMITEYVVPTSASYPTGIAAGPDGALWFTEFQGNNIGRITTAGVITEYLVPTAPTNSQPEAITTGPDGALWFTEYNTAQIGRITTTGVFTEFGPISGSNTQPAWGITTGPDGALWFTDTDGSRIGRITTAGVITEYNIPGAQPSYPVGITGGPDGALWFAESGSNGIGEAVFVSAGLTVTPANGSYHTSLTFTGSGFGSNEAVRVYSSGIGSAVLARGLADASGSFTTTASVPQSPYGPRLFLGVGQSSGRLGAATFSVTTPTLILSPNAGRIGSTVNATAYGFGSLEQVKINWISPPTVLGNVAANVAGTVTLKFKVPFGAFSGPNTVSAVGKTTRATASAPFTVQ